MRPKCRRCGTLTRALGILDGRSMQRGADDPAALTMAVAKAVEVHWCPKCDRADPTGYGWAA